MKCNDYEILISGFIDGELTDEQLDLLNNHLRECPKCQKEMGRAKMVQRALEMAAIRAPEDDFWDGYWAGIYNRLERNAGWIFFILGSIVLAGGGLAMLVRTLLFDAETPLWVSIGGILAIIGTVFLFVSLIRERLRIDRHERYKDIRR